MAVKPMTDLDLDILRWRGLAIKVCRRVARSRGMNPADLYPDAMVGLWRALRSWDEAKAKGKDIRLWLYVLTYQVTRLAAGRMRSPRKVGPNATSIHAVTFDYLEAKPDAAGEAKEQWSDERWNELVSCLQPAQAKIVLLCFRDGLDADEVARVTGWSKRTAWTMKNRAVECLRFQHKAGEVKLKEPADAVA